MMTFASPSPQPCFDGKSAVTPGSGAAQHQSSLATTAGRRAPHAPHVAGHHFIGNDGTNASRSDDGCGASVDGDSSARSTGAEDVNRSWRDHRRWLRNGDVPVLFMWDCVAMPYRIFSDCATAATFNRQSSHLIMYHSDGQIDVRQRSRISVKCVSVISGNGIFPYQLFSLATFYYWMIQAAWLVVFP